MYFLLEKDLSRSMRLFSFFLLIHDQNHFKDYIFIADSIIIRQYKLYKSIKYYSIQ